MPTTTPVPVKKCCTPCALTRMALSSLGYAWLAAFVALCAYAAYVGHVPHREPPHYLISVLALLIFWRRVCAVERVRG